MGLSKLEIGSWTDLQTRICQGLCFHSIFQVLFCFILCVYSIRDNAFQSLTISALNVNWRRTTYNALKIWSMKFSPLVPISNMCPTSYGHSNWTHLPVGGVRRTITTLKVVISATVKTKSTTSSERWFKTLFYTKDYRKIQKENGKSKCFSWNIGFINLVRFGK